MREMSLEKIVRQLAENTSDIISSGTDADTERLTALSHRQRCLTEALEESPPGEVPMAAVNGLRDLVEKAIETVSAEMGSNRGSMKVTGVKKKVLSAYGTVTLSSTSSK